MAEKLNQQPSLHWRSPPKTPSTIETLHLLVHGLIERPNLGAAGGKMEKNTVVFWESLHRN